MGDFHYHCLRLAQGLGLFKLAVVQTRLLITDVYYFVRMFIIKFPPAVKHRLDYTVWEQLYNGTL